MSSGCGPNTSKSTGLDAVMQPPFPYSPCRGAIRGWMYAPARRTISASVSVKPEGSAVATKPRVARRARRGWKFYALVGLGVPLLLVSAGTIYFYVTFSRMIDARLQGQAERADPRIFARTNRERRGQTLTPLQIVGRLNDPGYSHRAKAE